MNDSIIIMGLWGVAGTMVIFLAALKNVPRDLYEVAALDGAGPIRQFFSITLPMISGALFFNVIVLTIAAFQIFNEAYLLFWRDQSNASPEAALFYSIYLFQNAFERFDFGFASAMAWLLFVIIMAMWSVAGTMVIFLAALKNVPRDLYEVAALDGAGPVRQFFSITLPMISGAMFFNVIVLTIAAFQIFNEAYLLFWRDQSNASPEAALFYSIYLFQNAFERFDFGFASAMAWLLFVIIMIATAIQIRFGNRFVYYEGDK